MFILVISALGGLNGLDGLSNDGTVLQRSVPIASVFYGVCGIMAAVGVLMKRGANIPGFRGFATNRPPKKKRV